MIEVYITFGQSHTHTIEGVIFDKDCVGVIHCEDHSSGRGIAWDLFKDKFFTTYTKDTFKSEWLDIYYKRGLISCN